MGFLEPQALSAQMPDLADPSPLHYAQGGTGVRIDGRRELQLKSLAQDWIPSSSAEHATIPYVSASAEDNAMTRCCRLHDLIKCLPSMIAPPDVDLRELEQAAQSESV